MSTVETFLAKEIPDRELRAVTMRALNSVRLGMEKAICHHAEPQQYPIPSDRRSIEQLFLTRFRQLRPQVQQSAVERALSLARASQPDREKVYGDLARVDLKSTVAVRDQVQALAVPSELRPAVDQLYRLAPRVQTVLQAGAGPLQEPNRLELRIRSVECIRETKGEWARDDIYLGGLSFDLCGGVTTQIQSFKVADFKAGDPPKTYSPPRLFASFPLSRATDLVPFAATLVLAEKDLGGGLDARLKDLHTVTDKEVVEELVFGGFIVVGAIIGFLVGLVGGTVLLGPVGTVIGGAIGGAIGGFGGFLVGGIIYLLIDVLPKILSDDIFPEVAVLVSVGPDKRLPGGTLVFEPRPEKFEGFGGLYKLRYEWRLTTAGYSG